MLTEFLDSKVQSSGSDIDGDQMQQRRWFLHVFGGSSGQGASWLCWCVCRSGGSCSPWWLRLPALDGNPQSKGMRRGTARMAVVLTEVGGEQIVLKTTTCRRWGRSGRCQPEEVEEVVAVLERARLAPAPDPRV